MEKREKRKEWNEREKHSRIMPRCKMRGSPRIITSARHTENRSSGIIAGSKRVQPRASLNERGKNTMEKTRSSAERDRERERERGIDRREKSYGGA